MSKSVECWVAESEKRGGGSERWGGVREWRMERGRGEGKGGRERGKF